MGYGKFITVSEYCALTGLSRSGTYNRIRQGKLPVFNYSDKKLIPRSILEETNLNNSNSKEPLRR